LRENARANQKKKKGKRRNPPKRLTERGREFGKEGKGHNFSPPSLTEEREGGKAPIQPQIPPSKRKGKAAQKKETPLLRKGKEEGKSTQERRKERRVFKKKKSRK